jgi:CRP/FNR family transcriptional regulator
VAVLENEARHLQVPAGTMLFEEGAPCSGLPFVLAGTVRVARNASSGRSLERVLPANLHEVTPQGR